MTKTITLEKNRRFSESALWEYQRQFFDQNGVDAWASMVPFYITSNPFIGTSYANIIIRFIQDLEKQQALNPDQPLYIIELGTGPGRFSFYCLKQLMALRSQLKLDHINICYVMTDFTESNVKYWKEHPCLKAFVEQKVLDFAVFNLEVDQEITLINNNITLSANSVANPIVTIGNYIFDTITSDVFGFEKGQCFDMMTELDTPEDNVRDKKPINLEKINTSFTSQATSIKKRYDDKALNDILADYAESLRSTSILFPIGGLRAIRTIASWSNQKLLLISTDKGYNSTDELENLKNPRVTFHGSFSMMVNFHAIGEYFKKLGGEALQQSVRKCIKTSAFILGWKWDDLPETSTASDQYIEQFSPGDFFNMHEQLKKDKNTVDLKNVASHLRFSGWDPHIFGIFADNISKKIVDADTTTAGAILAGVPQLLSNIYPMPSGHDNFFDIALVFHSLNDYRSALIYYKQSLKQFGEKFTNVFNLALCYYSTNELENALAYFEKSLSINPSSDRAKEWIETTKQELQQ